MRFYEKNTMVYRMKLWVKNIASNLWMKSYPKIKKSLPALEGMWKKIETFAVNMLALTDHTGLRGVRVVLRFSILFLLILFFWAAFFKIDQVVHAGAQVVASSHTQIVQAIDGGALVELMVKEGDQVSAGQVLAVMEQERVLAAFTESQGKVMALKMTVARLRSEVMDQPLVFDVNIQKSHPDIYETQMNLYERRKRTIEEQLSVLRDNVKLTKFELEMSLPLEKMGDISRADILRLRRAVNEANSQYATAKNKYLQDASAELNKAQEDLNTQEQVMADKQQLLDHTEVLAPVTGIVKSIRVNTLGGVLRQGDEILQILPTESDLVVEAKIKPADMASIKVGLPVKIRLDAYDYAIFGTMSGRVIYVSADSLQEDSRSGVVYFYRIRVAINKSGIKNNGQNIGDIEVRPGMTASIDVETGKRSILQYLSKPLTKTLSNAFGER